MRSNHPGHHDQNMSKIDTQNYLKFQKQSLSFKACGNNQSQSTEAKFYGISAKQKCTSEKLVGDQFLVYASEDDEKR